MPINITLAYCQLISADHLLPSNNKFSYPRSNAYVSLF